MSVLAGSSNQARERRVGRVGFDTVMRGLLNTAVTNNQTKSHQTGRDASTAMAAGGFRRGGRFFPAARRWSHVAPEALRGIPSAALRLYRAGRARRVGSSLAARAW